MLYQNLLLPATLSKFRAILQILSTSRSCTYCNHLQVVGHTNDCHFFVLIVPLGFYCVFLCDL